MVFVLWLFWRQKQRGTGRSETAGDVFCVTQGIWQTCELEVITSWKPKVLLIPKVVLLYSTRSLIPIKKEQNVYKFCRVVKSKPIINPIHSKNSLQTYLKKTCYIHPIKKLCGNVFYTLTMASTQLNVLSHPWLPHRSRRCFHCHHGHPTNPWRFGGKSVTAL